MKYLRFLAYVLVIALFAAVMSAGCKAGEESGQGPGTKPVRVVVLQEEVRPVVLEYLGIIEAREMKKYGFKMAGKVAVIPVKTGQQVKKNQLLARLETKDLTLAVQAAENTMKKAKSAFDYAQDNYTKLEKLLEAGAVPRNDVDKARLELDVQKAAWKNAQLDFENKRNLLNDAGVLCDMDGVVADVLSKEGEVVAAGHPVVVVRSGALVAQAGVARQDVSRVSLNDPARVRVDNAVTSGRVTKIAQLPDSQTRTYNVEVQLADGSLPLGGMARVEIEVGEEKGIFIPISSILKSDRDYVFVVNGHRAKKKNVVLGEIRGTAIRVSGLAAGERLVVEGMRRLEDGDAITVQP